MRERAMQSRRFQWGASLAIVLLLLTSAGCGGDDSTKELDSSHSADGQGSLRAVHWGVVKIAQRSVKIGAFVPHCEYQNAIPHIEQIKKRRGPGRVTVTMLVRFPPKRPGCLGVGISVGRWLKIGHHPLELKFFDGKTSPPEEVQVGE